MSALPNSPPNAARYTVAVRTLCEFTARRGDLSFRFTPAPSAQQGVAGHRIVAARRGAHYLREVTLRGGYKSLMVRGRADGYDPQANRLEEVKTHRGDVAFVAANQRDLHWAQLKVYGALLCAQRDLAHIKLALVYFDIKSETETVLEEPFMAVELENFFQAHCAVFLEWAIREIRHRATRARFLGEANFPHAELHAGQRHMAETVYRTVKRGVSVMVEAPTGIGKTLGTLFPVLKAMRDRPIDKVFFLVAKTSGRAPALEALRGLGGATMPAGEDAAPLRLLELKSKESACVYPGRSCDGASCPLARGFYDRLPAARLAAVDAGDLTQSALHGIASRHEVCPYYLAQELARWSDVIVGDYNYFFDGSAILHALTVENQWRVAVLVDEAHNLLPRARDMYSATLHPGVLAAALAHAPATLRGHLAGVQRAWLDVSDANPDAYFVQSNIAPALLLSLQRATAAIGDHAEVPRADGARMDDALLRFYFDALHFLRLGEAFGDHSLFDVTRSALDASLCIRNVTPAPFLAPRFAACTSAVLFSATLSPGAYYRRLLGVPENTGWMEVASPFGAHQLEVRIDRRISTRYRDRPRSLEPIADLMARQYAARPGNYLAFFSSFAYLQSASSVFVHRHAQIPIWEQSARMDAHAREAFLERFTPSSRGIGFAVLGGAFGEGVDLPGSRLIGAFIATLGLPQVNAVNDQIEKRMHALFGAGYEYTYLYPGLQKVVQAAGRVIRTVSDQGTVHLMDDRFCGAEVRKLLPQWWRVQCD